MSAARQPATLAEMVRMQAESRGDATAFEFEGRTTSFAEVDRNTNRVANALKAFGVKVLEHPEAVARLEKHYGSPELFTPLRQRMARIPEGGTLIDNPVSTAPGFQIGNVFVMAGVPMIVEAMFGSLKHRLVGGKPMLSRQVKINLPEGTIAEPLAALQARYGDLEIGSYPAFRQGKVMTSLVLRGTDETQLVKAAEELAGILRQLGGEPGIEAT